MKTLILVLIHLIMGAVGIVTTIAILVGGAVYGLVYLVIDWTKYFHYKLTKGALK